MQKVLRHEGVSQAILSIAFVTGSQIQSLNKKFLNRGYLTDVLAFDLSTEGLARSSRRTIRQIEGEIVICPATAIKNAAIFKTSPTQELVLYIIHGILHLLGYDDHRPVDIKRMREKEAELMKLTGVLK